LSERKVSLEELLKKRPKIQKVMRSIDYYRLWEQSKRWFKDFEAFAKQHQEKMEGLRKLRNDLEKKREEAKLRYKHWELEGHGLMSMNKEGAFLRGRIDGIEDVLKRLDAQLGEADEK